MFITNKNKNSALKIMKETVHYILYTTILKFHGADLFQHKFHEAFKTENPLLTFGNATAAALASECSSHTQMPKPYASTLSCHFSFSLL